MKASNIIERYKRGERDFRESDITNESFQGQNLSGADFRGSDIRGTNFTQATLIETNFSGVQAGLSPNWYVFAGVMVITLTFLALSKSILVFTTCLTIAILILLLWLPKFAHSGRILFLAFSLSLGIFSIIGLIIGIIIAAMLFKYPLFNVIKNGILPIALAFLCVVVSVFIGTDAGVIKVAQNRIQEGSVKFALAVLYEFDKIFLTHTGGTNFGKANLLKSDFSDANLTYTNFCASDITLAQWRKAKKINKARFFGDIYLSIHKIQCIFMKGDGREQDFNELNLRGINLSGFQLDFSSFIGSDLSNADLKNSNLYRTNLVQTKLDGTNITGTNITGAYIENWGITHRTKLENIHCDYIFMRSPTQEDPNPHRQPEDRNRNFAEGEFVDFITPLLDALNLYHQPGADPRIISLALQQLKEHNPEAKLEVVAIENRGKYKEKLLLKVEASDDADLAKLEKDYFKNYKNLDSLSQDQLCKLLLKKDEEIEKLKNFLEFSRPAFTQTNNIYQGNTMSDQSKKTKIDQQNSKIVGIGVNTGNVEAKNIAETVYEGQPKSPAEAAAEIQKLLKQLEQSYPISTTGEQMAVATEVIKRIENDPTWKQRIVNALKAGTLKTFEETIDHPVARVLIAAIEGWKED